MEEKFQVGDLAGIEPEESYDTIKAARKAAHQRSQQTPGCSFGVFQNGCMIGAAYLVYPEYLDPLDPNTSKASYLNRGAIRKEKRSVAGALKRQANEETKEANKKSRER